MVHTQPSHIQEDRRHIRAVLTHQLELISILDIQHIHNKVTFNILMLLPDFWTECFVEN